MTPATYDTVQAYLHDRRRDAAAHHHPDHPARRDPSLGFTLTIEIARPVAEVFAFLEDFTRIPTWNYWVREVRKLTDGPIGVGTHFQQTRRDDQQTYRIVTHDPPHHLQIATLDGHRPAFIRTLDLHPAPTGTQLYDHWTLDTGHPALLQKLAAGRIRTGIATNLTHLRELLETGSTVLPDGRSVSHNTRRPHEPAPHGPWTVLIDPRASTEPRVDHVPTSRPGIVWSRPN